MDSAFKEFYKKGYQGANIASILEEVGINKGSMYHFFTSKKELALAVIKERISKNIVEKYTYVAEAPECVQALFDTLLFAPESLEYGCPLNKMSQEMVYLDEAFSQALTEVYHTFEGLIEMILSRGMHQGEIPLCDTLVSARALISTYEGALMIYHLNRDREAFESALMLTRAALRQGID